MNRPSADAGGPCHAGVGRCLVPAVLGTKRSIGIVAGRWRVGPKRRKHSGDARGEGGGRLGTGSTLE